MPLRSNAAVATALALSLGLALAGCGDTPNNRSLYSVKQPVIERNTYTLDLAAGAGGLLIPEQQRLTEWFEAMELGYGDRVSYESAMESEATREDIAALAGRHGILLSEGSPVTSGFVEPGAVRVTITRSRAHVPGCPDWTDQLSANLDNSTTDDFGCSVNSNLAAMIADPEHLLKGAERTGDTVILGSSSVGAGNGGAPASAGGSSAGDQ